MDPILGSSSVWVTPQARDLLQGSLIKCYVPGCKSTFKNSGNLQMHLDKHHKIAPAAKKEPPCTKLFFCPQPNCMYNAKSAAKKHFKSLKYLRQHFQKVHAEKIFKCSKCSKSFGTASMRDCHMRNCGKDFSCKVCDWSYDSSEALLTHAKRKGHKQNKDSNENSGKVAIPRLKSKSLAAIVLEVTNCIGPDENCDDTAEIDSQDYADVLELPETLEAISESINESEKAKREQEKKEANENSVVETNPTFSQDCDNLRVVESKNCPDGLMTPPRSDETSETTDFSHVLKSPPHFAEDTTSFPRVLVSPETTSDTVETTTPHRQDLEDDAQFCPQMATSGHHSDSVNVTGFSESLETTIECREVVITASPRRTEPEDLTGFSQCPKTPPHHANSLDSTIYCPELTNPLHPSEPVNPTSYSRCLETPRHCPDPDEDSNYSRDLETPPCINADESAEFSADLPEANSEQYPAEVDKAPEIPSKYSTTICTEAAAEITFSHPARAPTCSVAVETSNCIETQTENDTISIALPPKKRLKVATSPPLNHFTDPPFCDIETQTEFDFRTRPCDPMLYTDMHTQTCHEFLTELGLSDIQTQTNWSANDMDDTSTPHSKRFSSGAYDELMVSTETQTSSTQCLLESCNEEDSLSGCITQHTQTCDFLLEGLFGNGNNDLIGGFQSSLRLDCFRPENNDR